MLNQKTNASITDWRQHNHMVTTSKGVILITSNEVKKSRISNSAKTNLKGPNKLKMSQNEEIQFKKSNEIKLLNFGLIIYNFMCNRVKRFNPFEPHTINHQRNNKKNKRPTNFYILTRALVAFLGAPRFRFSPIGKFLISSGMVNADDVLANVRFVIAGTTTLAAVEVLIVECDDSAHVDSTDENIEALPTCLLQRALIGFNIG
ncbi:hypothetical protein BpHYR1_037497 [Brachionus plicatilis]|uniref:Uncharacterized protein n=1 Tax=Brachionus plicatilis TaxID=10195 RepID=A0A3M7PGW0_BRAPC|nr:hypothetical protein BpHYR1_037497 [Brachionus plicatilis]